MTHPKTNTNPRTQTKAKPPVCDRKMSFAECELAILRSAVDHAEQKHGKQIANSDEVKRIIHIVEEFIKRKQLICYGGTAINNILPKESQFYNKDVEIPDYDFYSANALDDAKRLVDIYVAHGFSDVQANSGQHHGTYKVFVNFIPVADITYIQKDLFMAIKRKSLRVGGILYAPPNWLRMNLYLELSRPDGDTSRWEKVLKRLTLLNKHYPLSLDKEKEKQEKQGQKKGQKQGQKTGEKQEQKKNKPRCDLSPFQRQMSSIKDKSKVDAIYETVQQTFINEGVVFFGGYALSLYSQYMPPALRHKLQKNPDFDVLTTEPIETAEKVKERLADIGVHNVKLIQRPSLGDIVAPHIEICVGLDTIAFVYEPIACHSYNVVKQHNQSIKVATIDTMLSFWLVFLYANRPYYDPTRVLCMSKFLFDVQEKNRLSQKGLMRRFSINCVGHQQTVEEMRAEKAKKYQELKGNRNRRNQREFEEWFLRYVPTATKEKETKAKETKTKEETKAKSKSIKAKETKETKAKSSFAAFFSSSNKRKRKMNTNANANANTRKKRQKQEQEQEQEQEQKSQKTQTQKQKQSKKKKSHVFGLW